MRITVSSSDLDAAECIALFNLYVLPFLVAAVVLVSYRRGRQRPVDARRERARAVRLLGLCQYGLALRALLMVVPEWVAYREAGAFASLAVVNVFWPLLMAVLLVPLGLGLRRLQPWARWGAVALHGLLAVIAVLVARWMIVYGAAIYAWDWPEVAAGRILPFFVLLVLLAPGTAAVFRAEDRAALRREAALARPSRLALAALGFLSVLGAIVVINAFDWLFRYVLHS